MSSQYDYFTLSLIHRACYRHREEQIAAGHDWVHMTNPGHVFEAIKNGEVDSIVSGGYLMVYAIGTSWMNRDAKVFEELLTLRIEKGPGDLSHVLSCWDELATEAACDYILCGSSTSRVFGKYLSRNGYAEIAQVHMRKLP